MTPERTAPMTDPTDLIAQADAAIDRVVNAPQGIVDPLYVARSASLVPALRDALAAALTRAELAERHAEAMEAENARMREALEEAACYGCTCDPAYYERGLAAPDCMANLVSDDAREALGMAAVCKGSAAARATAPASRASEGDET